MTAAYEAVIPNKESKRQVRRFRDSDAAGDHDFELRSVVLRVNCDGAFRHIDVIMPQSYSKRAGEFAWSVGEVFEPVHAGTTLVHPLQTAQRLHSSNQHATRDSLWLGDEVQTLIHSINQVDIGMAGRPEKDPVARGRATSGVRRAIVHAQVSFGLDDPPGGGAVHQNFAEKRASHLDRPMLVKGSGKRWLNW